MMQNVQHLPVETIDNRALEQQRRVRKMRDTIIYHLGVGIIGILMLYPILWLVSSSFKPTEEIWTTVNSLIPSSLHFENYINGFKGFGGTTFLTFYKNSFIYAGFGTLFVVVTSTLIAYGFARISFTGKRIFFAVMLMTLMLPNQVLLIPQYIIFSGLGWINTFLPLLLPRLGGDVFFIFMIMQFIRGIPIDLDEAAMIDGADQFGIFFHVILPQLAPVTVSVIIMKGIGAWNEAAA